MKQNESPHWKLQLENNLDRIADIHSDLILLSQLIIIKFATLESLEFIFVFQIHKRVYSIFFFQMIRNTTKTKVDIYEIIMDANNLLHFCYNLHTTSVKKKCGAPLVRVVLVCIKRNNKSSYKVPFAQVLKLF